MNSILPNTRTVEARTYTDDAATLSARIEHFRDTAFTPSLIRPHRTRAKVSWKDCEGLPEISATALNSALLIAGVRTRGALIVRNMLPKQTIPALLAATDAVTETCAHTTGNKYDGTPRSHYFNPPDILREVMTGTELGYSRGFHRDSGSAMCVEAPSVAEALLELYEAIGLKSVLRNYFREPACLSVKKWVLRKSRFPVSEAGWHQDGAFMGTDINSLNMWIPLTHCGGDTGAPGMDLLPIRLEHILSADGAVFDWSVKLEENSTHLGNTSWVSPVFNPGDALFFDHLFLHRTQYRPSFERPRHAIETWFFGSSCAPRNQIPLYW